MTRLGKLAAYVVGLKRDLAHLEGRVDQIQEYLESLGPPGPITVTVSPIVLKEEGSMEEDRFKLLLSEAAQAGPEIFDYEGVPATLEWLRGTFGLVKWTRAEPHPDAPWVFRLVQLRAKCGPASLIVRVIDEDGQPLKKYAVVRYWPGAPELPDFGGTTAKQWTTHGIVGKTNDNGDVGFGLGKGDYYHPENGETGVTKVYVADFDGPGDFLEGLGMLGGTEHCHIDATFQRVAKGEEPPPSPSPEPSPEPGGWNIDLRLTGNIKQG
jgi:hypothetical protein